MECKFCPKKVDDSDHLLECDMLLAHLFNGCTSLSCPEEAIINLVSCVKNPNKLPTLRWRTILELCEELQKMTKPPNNTMYN